MYFFYGNLFDRIVRLGEPEWGPPWLTTVPPGKCRDCFWTYTTTTSLQRLEFIKRYAAGIKTKLKKISLTVPQQIMSKSRIMSSSSWMSRLIHHLQHRSSNLVCKHLVVLDQYPSAQTTTNSSFSTVGRLPDAQLLISLVTLIQE